VKQSLHPQNKPIKYFLPTFTGLIKITTALFVFLCICLHCSFAKDQQIIITVKNQLNLDRSNEMVAVRWNDLTHIVSTLDTANVFVLDGKSTKELITQIISDIQTGTPQELIFQSDFKAKETKQFIVRAMKRAPRKILSLTDARFMAPREDIAWENDRIAHRIYGPALAKGVNNGIDVWTKRVRYLIVEKWYKGDEAAGTMRISYHEDHGEGADFFDVGRSLGDGSCALYRNDSLYQPGVFSNYKILATGPLRAMFEVTYKPVQFNGKIVSEVKRISLDAGSNLNAVEVTYKCDSLNDGVLFAAGLVKRKGTSSITDTVSACGGLWGPTNAQEENGALGTGIVMTKDVFNAFKEDKVHVLVLGNAELNKPLTYYAGAGWTRSGDFRNAEDWKKYLLEFSQRLASPLQVDVSREK
jgi:pectinesterase